MKNLTSYILYAWLIIFSCVAIALEPSDVSFDGEVLTVPYLAFGDRIYELRFEPIDSATLGAKECPILCLRLLSAKDSELTSARDPAIFDGQTLSTPRVVLGNEVFTGTFQYLSHHTADIYFSVETAKVAQLFSQSDRKNWTADELEKNLSFCKENSYRWDTPFPFGDFNNDGFEDIFIPIACYQGPTPDNGGINNLSVKTGWYLLCSNNAGAYKNCTEELFGSEFIDTSRDGGRGGLPYHHNTEEPKDLNGDGYIDFALTLNRDDGIGRRSYDTSSNADFETLISDCFNGDTELVENVPRYKLGTCAYWSDQYVFLSNGDGTYTNAKIPWGATWTHSMRSIPNDIGGFDLISIGYDINRVARIIDNKVIDVTDMYSEYENFLWATQINPYVGGYFEFDGTGYWIANGVRPELVTNIAEYSEFDIETGWYGTVEGISVWEWIPGKGFKFSDYYMPPVENLFSYLNEAGSVTTGVYKRGIPQFGGGGSNFYNFMKQAVMDPEEGPVLIVQGENGSFISNYRRKISSDFVNVGRSANSFIEGAEFPVAVLEGFTINGGKIVEREKSVIEGDVIFNSPGMYFRDIDKDGFDDLLTITGMTVRGGAYLNKEGTLVRVDTTSVMPDLPKAPMTDKNTATLFWPLRNNGTIDLLYMDRGQVNVPNWWTDEEIFDAGNLGIIRSNYTIDSLPINTVLDQLNNFASCAKTASSNLAIGWFWNCAY
jgi:hypothetical protein